MTATATSTVEEVAKWLKHVAKALKVTFLDSGALLAQLDGYCFGLLCHGSELPHSTHPGMAAKEWEPVAAAFKAHVDKGTPLLLL